MLDYWVLIEEHYLDNFIDTYTIDTIDLDENEDNDINDNFIANGIVVHNASCK